jgi:hypothetical protein
MRYAAKSLLPQWLSRAAIASALALPGLLGSVSAQAQAADLAEGTTPTAAKSPFGHHLHISAVDRVVVDQASPVEVRPIEAGDPDRNEQDTVWDQRLRLSAEWRWMQPTGFVRIAEAHLQADLRTLSYNQLRLGEKGFLLRRAWAEVTTLAGQFAVGRTLSTWGLGLIAQAGDDDPLQFGVRRGGNIVHRAQYAILPGALFHKGDPFKAFPLALAIAYDDVVTDDLVQYNGDEAQQVVAAALYRGKELQAGAYGVWREQKDRNGLRLDVTIVDAFAAYGRKFGDVGIKLAAEGVYIFGTTTWLRSANTPDGSDVAQVGGLARAEVTAKNVTVRLDAGYASGDSRPLDDTLRNFRMAADYRAGLVLFQQVQRRHGLTAEQRLSDPRYSANPPEGVERVRTDGAVTQALFLHPVVRAQATEHLALLFGAVYAEAPADVADPFQSYLAGGTPTGPRGAKNKRSLGTEFDAGIELRLPLWGKEIQLLSRVDAGVWLPGDAFDDANGKPASAVGAVQGQLAVEITL